MRGTTKLHKRLPQSLRHLPDNPSNTSPEGDTDASAISRGLLRGVLQPLPVLLFIMRINQIRHQPKGWKQFTALLRHAITTKLHGTGGNADQQCACFVTMRNQLRQSIGLHRLPTACHIAACQ